MYNVYNIAILFFAVSIVVPPEETLPPGSGKLLHFHFLRCGQICHFKASFYKKASFYNKLFFEKKSRCFKACFFFADVCDKCIIRNGVGFNPHPENCYKFVQCYFGAKGEIRSAIRSCPFGQYWDQDALTCKLAKQVSCPKGTPLFQIS